MKIQVGYTEAEGFASSLLLRLPNGLTLKSTKSLIWMGSDERRESVKLFREAIQDLKDAGIEIEGEEILAKFGE